MAETLPWHAWFHATWLASETRFSMSLAERGLYRDALDLHYQEGSIPANLTTLRRMLGVEEVDFGEAWPKVSTHFQTAAKDDTRLVNRKALVGLERAEEQRQKQSANGRKGGRPKKPTETQTKANDNPNESDGLAKRNPNESQPKPKRKPNESPKKNSSSSPEEEEHFNASGDAIDGVSFDIWYEGFPRKVGKPAGRKSFASVIIDGKLPDGAVASDMDGLTGSSERFERLMATAAAWKRKLESRDAEKRPHPSTFINSLDWIMKPEVAKVEPDGMDFSYVHDQSRYYKGVPAKKEIA